MDTERRVIIDQDFANRVEGYRAILFEAKVANSETTEELKQALDKQAEKISTDYQLVDINKIPGIYETRKAYKACGKDPNRYRPSQEQLMRRIVKGLGLYNVNNLVDAGNLISLKTGCSIGFFDADKIVGDTLYLGIGKKDEPYVGIGRGNLNIEGLPVFRDAVGGIGTPTSDNERTKIEIDTTNLLITIHLFNQDFKSEEIVEIVKNTLIKYCNATDIFWYEFRP